MTLLLCDELITLFKDPTLLLEAAWKWWLYGGPPRYEDPKSALHNSSTSACLLFLYRMFPDTDLMNAVLDVSSSFGGVPAIAELALSAFHSCALTKDHAEDARFHFFPFCASFISKVDVDGKQFVDEFIKAIYELDGMAKLVEGLTHIATFSRADILPDNRDWESFVAVALVILKTIVTTSRRANRARRELWHSRVIPCA